MVDHQYTIITVQSRALYVMSLILLLSAAFQSAI